MKRNFWYEMEGVVFNDCFIISFEGEHQMLWLLNAHDMHVNDDYASTSRVKLFWKFYGLYYNIWSKPYNLMHRNSIFFLSHDQWVNWLNYGTTFDVLLLFFDFEREESYNYIICGVDSN